jgi:hypothetical protein
VAKHPVRPRVPQLEVILVAGIEIEQQVAADSARSCPASSSAVRSKLLVRARTNSSKLTSPLRVRMLN